MGIWRTSMCPVVLQKVRWEGQEGAETCLANFQTGLLSCDVILADTYWWWCWVVKETPEESFVRVDKIIKDKKHCNSSVWTRKKVATVSVNMVKNCCTHITLKSLAMKKKGIKVHLQSCKRLVCDWDILRFRVPQHSCDIWERARQLGHRRLFVVIHDLGVWSKHIRGLFSPLVFVKSVSFAKGLK